ncbi:unnamed protein product [Fraxinus pennsylvanica]|uniref:Zinc finger CCCH domain-containing protein 13-like n=1 Tax=Fraxinus pennsylvanica TaxID=56036 RepID=A0AAD1ZTX1_9LAMI|nr:unnamed protein product [Fraxinus pennsylvanica]
MTRSSRHKSHKQSKDSSKDYSDSEEDVKLKEKSSRDENPARDYRGSTSGEKRKISSVLREGNDGKDLRNGEASEDYVLSKLRKEKADVGKARADVSVGVGDDRWRSYGEDKGGTDRNIKKELNKRESSKIDSKLKESNSKGETLRIESKIKRKRYEIGSGGEIKEDNIASLSVEKEESERKGESKRDNIASLAVEKEESVRKGESKRKSEKDSSGRKEGKESKDKGRGSEKEKRVSEESMRGDAEVKSMGVFGQKQGSQLGDFSEETKTKLDRENTECPLQDELRNPGLEKELEKRIRRRKEGSNVRDKHYDDFKEIDERLLLSRGDPAKDVKYREDRHKDGGNKDKYQKDGQKDGKHRDDKYRDDADKYSKFRDGKYREDGDRDARHRDERRREDGNRDSRHGDENFRDDGGKDNKQKDDEYWEGTARDIQNKDDKYAEDGERGNRRRDDRYHGDIDKYGRRNDERYHEDGDKDDRQRGDYREDGDRDGRYKEDKHREDIERDCRHKDSKRGDDFGRVDRLREAKYRDEHASRDFSADKSEPKHSRDDGYGENRRSRKLKAYDYSPKLGDQTARYKDDQGRRKTKDKADYDDNRSQITKVKDLESEKKSASGVRMGVVTERERSISKNADVELTSNHIRRHSSPSSSSHGTRDPNRLPKQEDSKYYAYEERVRYSRDYSSAAGGASRTTPSRSMDKLDIKEDSQLGELSAERRLKSDIRSSPLQLVDKSSASSTDWRFFARSDVRQSLDVEESAKRSGALLDAKGYSGKEGRGRRELVMDILPGDELSQADADNLSVSSPFTRNSHLSNSFKSMQPAPLFRTGLESPLLLGSAEDNGRSQSNSHNRRIGNTNMGRVQGNALRGVPNWPSPLVNGFMPFPHGPPFHSVMQQFHGPPIFGSRSSMELNHPSPYHMPDADRFSGPGRPLGWHNPVDDSCPPPLYGWDSSSAVYGEDSQIYGRPDWDHSRNLPCSRGWETRGDLWNGPYKSASIDMPSSDKENGFSQIADEPLVDQTIQQAKSELTGPDKHAESTDISQSRDGLGRNSAEASYINQEEPSDIAKMSRNDNSYLCHVYFSKLDISADLTESKLFNKCTGFLDIDQSIISDVHDSELFFMEEAVEATAASPSKINNFSLFSATSDSIFQKALSLYKRQKEDFGGSANMESILKSNEELNAEDNNTERSPSGGMQEVGNALPNSNGEVEISNSLQVEENTKNSHLKLNLPVASVVDKSEPVSASNHVTNEVDLVLNQVPQERILENPLSSECVEKFDGSLSAGVGEVHMEFASNNEEQSVFDTNCGPVRNSDVSFESHEAMMPELIESAPVNLSRIHHSPESTH